jgi:DNA-binding NarL/FixJ family response regulator
MTLTLLLADDHQIVRQGLQALLGAQPDFQVVGEAADGPEAVRLTERLRPHVLVLDLTMPGLNGLAVAREVARRAPRTRVVILSMHSDSAYVLEALRAGALAYVLKDAGAEELIRGIREAAEGRHYLSPPFSPDALGQYLRKAEGAPVDPYATLSAREREVLQLTVEGNSGVEIAGRLFISPRTVETHRANLMRKLGVRNQKELIRAALQHGILVK